MDSEKVTKEENITEDVKISDNVEILKKHFPSCFEKDGRFNLERFKKEIEMNEINLSKESYGLEWLGKSYARVLTFEPARTLLKEDEGWNRKEENKNSGNILIKGDNLEVLKHLVNAYYEKIKMIYIDPPYNTGNDGFVYQDDRKFTVKELMELAGVDEERAKRILDFVNSKSNSHSAWLTFMYPRLYIARRLLREDGVIFVSIDDNEVAQLRILMDEIFGEENFVAEFPRSVGTVPKTTEAIQNRHDYVLCYARSPENSFGVDEDISEEHFKFDDNDGRGVYALIHPLDSGTLGYIKTLDYEIKFNGKSFFPGGHIENKPNNVWRWRWSKDLVEWGIKNNLIVEKNNRLYTKNYRNLKIEKIGNTYALVEKEAGKPFTSDVLMREDFGNRVATREIKEILGGGYFNHPKPTNLIKKLIHIIGGDKDAVILDFFAGSGTTGDAVMQLNAEDGGNRKYILVQLPEPIDPKKNKAAYDFVKNELEVEEPTIFEICKERLVRAGKKIKMDNKDKDLSNVDFGFKIFETIPIWEDYLADEKELTEQTTLFDIGKLNEDDLKALLITWKTFDGLPLTEGCKEVKLNDYTTYYCGTNLYLLHSNWKTENIKTLLEKIDADNDFVVEKIIVFGYNFNSKDLREIEENIRNYSNKKQIEIETILRF